MKNVLVDFERLCYLEARSLKLDYLECGGVDNWSEYGSALNPESPDYDDEDECAIDFDDAKLELMQELEEEFK